MKHGVKYVVGFAAGTLFALVTSSVAAQSNGPYYATPSWDQKLQCDTQVTCPRFIVLLNWTGPAPGPGGTIIAVTQAVLDRETGLVWEQSPSVSFFLWAAARSHCINLQLGNRKGWRLPTVQELESLVDPTVAHPGPTLPAGHPFMNVGPFAAYWSATQSDAFDEWGVFFSDGSAQSVDIGAGELFVWCVRGGQGADIQ